MTLLPLNYFVLLNQCDFNKRGFSPHKYMRRGANKNRLRNNDLKLQYYTKIH